MYETDIAEAIVDRRKMGLVVFDKVGDVLYCSPLAESQLQAASFFIANGKITTHNGANQRNFCNKLSKCFLERGRRESWFVLGGDATDAIVLSLQYCERTDDGVVLGLIRSPGADDSEVDQPRIMEAFGLTPREAQLSLHLSRGKDLVEFADSHFLTKNTVRSHLKQLFKKMGVNKQIQVAVVVWAALR